MSLPHSSYPKDLSFSLSRPGQVARLEVYGGRNLDRFLEVRAAGQAPALGLRRGRLLSHAIADRIGRRSFDHVPSAVASLDFFAQPRPARPTSQPGVAPKKARLFLEQLDARALPSGYTPLALSGLIADINAANAAGGANTISLTAPATSPYVLTAVNNTTDGATGLPVIAANDNLTIVGNGDTIERSTASGTADFRLFDVAAGASLTLQNLTLQGGLAADSGVSAEGGAIDNQGALTLSGVTVQNNIAQGRSVSGEGSFGRERRGRSRRRHLLQAAH